MKKCFNIILKVMIGYIVNSVVVLIIVFLLSMISDLDLFDALLIIGTGTLLVSFLISGTYTRSLPAISPYQKAGSDDGMIGTSLVNVAAEALTEKTNDNREVFHWKNRNILRYYLFNRSRLEIISYGIILILLGLIKYYSYF